MAKRSYARRSKRKSRKRRSRRRVGRRGRINRAHGSLLPERMTVTHRFSQEFDMTDSTTGSTNLYRLNSLYDPDQTGVGHQPILRDQMTLLYNRYRVTKAVVTVRTVVYREGTTYNDDQGILCHHWFSGGSGAAGQMTVSGVPYTEWKEGDDNAVQILSGLDEKYSKTFFKRTIYMNALAGEDTSKDNEWSSYASGNPGLLGWYQLSMYKATTAARVRCKVFLDIKQTAQWTQPLKVVGS